MRCPYCVVLVANSIGELPSHVLQLAILVCHCLVTQIVVSLYYLF